MKTMRSIIGPAVLIGMALGCQPAPREYGTEAQVYFPAKHRQVWAVAPAVNLSGQEVDPLLQADDLYEQLQQIHGLTVVPVNRVMQVFAALKISKVQSADQANLVCQELGCDALVVPTITIFDPYDPPKFGAAVQVFRKGQTELPPNVDVRQLSRAATPPPTAPLPAPGLAAFKQSVGVFDATNGSVRKRLTDYADGRHDPVGPLGQREYLLNMDRYCGFVYHELIVDLMRSMNG